MVVTQWHKNVFSVALSLLLMMFVAVPSLFANESCNDDSHPRGTLGTTRSNMPQWEELGLEDLIVYSEESNFVVQFGAKEQTNCQSLQTTASDVAPLHSGKTHCQRALRFAPRALRLSTYLYFLYQFRL